MKKKVLIISQESYEPSTEHVIDWILNFGNQFYRLNGDDFEKATSNILLKGSKEICITLNGEQINQTFHSIWFRRWSQKKYIDNLFNLWKDNNLSDRLLFNVLLNRMSDDRIIEEAVIKSFKSKKKITSSNQIFVNKVTVLLKAGQCGIFVPNFIITSSKKELVDFYKKEQKIIIKDINSPFSHENGSNLFVNYVSLVDEQSIKKMPDTFGLSFFQKFVDKDFEIRAFFLMNKFYCMAIFSQKNDKTKIDFRNYDYEKPNRTVPYKLPIKAENRLCKLMKKLNLETGSIDLLVDKNGELHFLEVNPVGQFGMVSAPCNYLLEQKIANYLCK